jgi:type III restriction enzyme
VEFSNSLHKKYSGLNKFELEIARTLDRTQRIWCRNSEGVGYFIPLLDRGSTATFWPDFLVWIDRTVFAIDTKGDHLLAEDSRRKLFEIDSTGEKPRIVLRLISQGEWNVSPSGQVGKHGSGGFTVWRWASGQLKAVICEDAKSAVNTSLVH